MKVAILTLCTNNNYGNRLQNYALQKFLSIYIETVDTIWFEKNHYLPELPTWNWKLILKCILRWKNAYIDFKYNYVKECIREYNIKKFSNKYIKIKYDYKIRNNLNEEYDYFIVGSDQVWNPLFGCGTEIEYLRFARKEQKICFSPSFGISELPDEEKEFVKESLLSFDKISVREEEGKRLIYDVSGKKAEVLIDPTMMLTPEEWLSVSKEVNIKNSSPYILVYFLGDRDRNRDKVVSTIAKKYSLDEYRLVDLSNHELYKAGPAEFIKLICNAKLVCTDSFHAIVFSIIFKIPFIVFGRAGGTGMNSRINTLLRKFKLEDRVNENFDINKVFEIDYSNVDEILKGERKKVMEYFKEYITI